MAVGSRLGARLRHLSTEDRRIARDAVVVAVFALAAKLIAAAKEIAIAWRYGVSEIVDAYLFVFNFLLLPVTVWFGVLTVVYIPLAAKLRSQRSSGLHELRSELLGAAIVTGIGLALVAAGALLAFFASSWSGFPEEARRVSLEITPWMAVLIPLGLATHWGSVQMMSESRHGNTFYEGIPALVLLVTVVAAPMSGAWPLVWGSVAGAALHLLVTLAATERGARIERPRFSMRSPLWKPFWAGAALVLLGQLLQNLTGIVDQLFAARLGEGSVSILGYVSRVLSLILSLGAMAVARAALPIFSRMQAEGGNRLRRVACRWAVILFAGGAAVLLVSWPASEWGIRLLFERGAFDSADTAMVAEIFRYSLVQVPFYFASIVLVYAVLSRGDYAAVTGLGAVNLVAKVGASLLLVPAFGLAGLMFSTALVYALSCALAWHLLARRGKR